MNRYNQAAHLTQDINKPLLFKWTVNYDLIRETSGFPLGFSLLYCLITIGLAYTVTHVYIENGTHSTESPNVKIAFFHYIESALKGKNSLPLLLS